MRILGIDPGYAILGYGVLDIIGNKFVTVAYGQQDGNAGTARRALRRADGDYTDL